MTQAPPAFSVTEEDRAFSEGFRDALDCVAQAKEFNAEVLMDAAGSFSRAGDTETAEELRRIAGVSRRERRLIDALSRYREFHAYRAAEPHTIKFVFANVNDQLAAANAMDAVVPRTTAESTAAALAPQPVAVTASRKKLTAEYLAMTPRQKWETLALNGLLGTDEPWIDDMRETLRQYDAPQTASEGEVQFEDCSSAEPDLRTVLRFYYRQAFSYAEADDLALKYLAALRHGEQSNG